MGGNALNIETRRYSKQEYNTIASEVSLVLKNRGIKHFITKSYNNKEDFGDLDVLISTESIKDSNELFQLIIDNFETNEVHRNKTVISFEYREFQIDFILIKKKDWATSKVYYSYNDLGNLMGRIAVRLGFRYGHFGLRFQYNSVHGGKTLKIDVSRNPEKIFAFLGFSYNLFKNGFNDLNDIFDYVVFSKYFNKNIFQYSELNHQNKTRNKKRVNYNLFLKYIDNNKIIKPLTYDTGDIDFINEAEQYFNIDIKETVRKFDHDIYITKRNDKTVERLNAKVITEHFEIVGKEIGDGIVNFKKNVEKEFETTWQDFVNSNDEDVVMKFFCKYNNLYNKTKKEWLKF